MFTFFRKKITDTDKRPCLFSSCLQFVILFFKDVVVHTISCWKTRVAQDFPPMRNIAQDYSERGISHLFNYRWIGGNADESKDVSWHHKQDQNASASIGYHTFLPTHTRLFINTIQPIPRCSEDKLYWINYILDKPKSIYWINWTPLC